MRHLFLHLQKLCSFVGKKSSILVISLIKIYFHKWISFPYKYILPWKGNGLIIITSYFHHPEDMNKSLYNFPQYSFSLNKLIKSIIRYIVRIFFLSITTSITITTNVRFNIISITYKLNKNKLIGLWLDIELICHDTM